MAGLRSVVEDVPADGAPALLIIENEVTDGGREMLPLPLPFLGPSSWSVAGWDPCAGRPDGVRRSAQVMGGDVSHRNRLARRQCSELHWIGHPARRGIRLERRSVCVTHAHLTAHPGSTDIDGVAGPAVARLMILEQMQHVLGAQEGPVSQESVVFVRQSAPATDGDQPRVTLFREDWHTPIRTIHRGMAVFQTVWSLESRRLAPRARPLVRAVASRARRFGLQQRRWQATTIGVTQRNSANSGLDF